MEKFLASLKKTKTLSESIGKIGLENLSNNLISDYDCEEEMENHLLYFFSLNSRDVEVLLKIMRKKSITEDAEDKIGGKFLRENEKNIAAMVRKMNKISMKEVNKPFHLAAALGELEIPEKTQVAFRMNIENLFKESTGKTLKRVQCPIGSFPRYVGKVWPWKLRMAFRTRMKQRREDVGCHFQHGPFKGTIRGWVTFNIRVVIMVLLQGWGGKLAANNNHFFYKWWFVVAVGLSPYSCHWLLLARKY